MVSISSKKAFMEQHTIWFPEWQGIEGMIHRLRWNDILKVRQAGFIPRTTQNCVSCREFLTICIGLDRSSDDLWSDVRKTTRNSIRRAIEYGDDVGIIINGVECNVDFLHLYNRFVEAKGHTAPMSAESFRRLRPLTDISIAYYQERPLVVHMLLKDTDVGRVRSLYLASERLEDDESAKACSILSRYLHWYEIEHYKAEGFIIYDLGGIPGLDHPRTIFKQSFGGRVVTEYDCIYARPAGRLALKARDILRQVKCRHRFAWLRG